MRRLIAFLMLGTAAALAVWIALRAEPDGERKLAIELTAKVPAPLTKGPAAVPADPLGAGAARDAVAPDEGADSADIAAPLRGLVVDPDQRPVAGAHVALDAAGTPASTSDDGRFAMVNAPPGRHTIVVSAAGFQTLRRGPVTLFEGESFDAGTFVMRPECRVRGLVVDETGAPLADVTIDVVQRGTTKNALDGSFDLRPLAPGNVALRFVKDGYATTRVDVVLEEGRSVDDLRVTLPHEASITGRVTDVDAVPICGVSVVTLNAVGDAQPGATDADGVYRISRLRPGTVLDLMTMAPAHGDARKDAVPAGATGVDFVLAPMPGISVHVVEEATGEPASKINVRFESGGRLIDIGLSTGPGVHFIRLREPGAGFAVVHRNGLEVGRSSELVFDGKERLGPIVVTIAGPPPGLTGVVQRASDGAAVEGVWVWKVDPAVEPGENVVQGVPAVMLSPIVTGYVLTDTAGRFTLHHVPTKPFRLSVLAPGASGFLSALYPAGTHDAGKLLVPTGGDVHGTVIDFDGTPARDLPVVAIAESGVACVARTDSAGLYRLANLAPGLWRIAPGNAHAATGRAKRHPLVDVKPLAANVKPGGQTQLDLDLRRLGAGLRAIVRLDGVPAAGLRVGLQPGEFECGTDDQGAAGFGPVRAGSYTLRVVKNSSLPPLAERTVVLRLGLLERLEIDIVRASVVVHADARSGLDVTSARVALFAAGAPQGAAPAADARGDARAGITIRDLVPATYRALVECSGGAAVGAPFTLAAETTHVERVAIEPFGFAELRIEDQDGAAPPALVRAWRDGVPLAGAVRHAVQGESDIVRLELPPGRCRIVAESDDLHGETHLDVRSGATISATITLAAEKP